jgi:uncharacterized membrane protein YfcA
MLTKIVLGLLLIFTLFFTFILLNDFLKAKKANKLEKETNFMAVGVVGFIALFFDALGIGSFSTITAMVKNFKLTKDKTLPGTLIVSTTIAGAIEAFIFVTAIKVDPLTLIVMTVAASLGAFIGAGIVSKLPEKLIQLVMGTALAVVALLILLGQLKFMPVGGDTIGLTGVNLVIAGVVLFILGSLMTVGVGLFAPTMALVYAMGMSPAAAFPIMMTACAFLQPSAGFKFIKEGTYDRKASLAITIFGVIGALIACYLVKSIPLVALKWIVFAVVLYTSYKMFKSYRTNKTAGKSSSTTAA